MPDVSKRGKKLHWAVLMLDRALERTDARYHEYGSPGKTMCGRAFYLTSVNYGNDLFAKPAKWVNRKNAEKFAARCRDCAREMEYE